MFQSGPTVTDIKLKRAERTLYVSFDSGEQFALPCEYLRVYSPSAEVHGHGRPRLVQNKKMVNIKAIDPVGNYAVKLTFDDGHDSGIYNWQLLYLLGRDQAKMWGQYLDAIQAAKGSREPLIDINVKFS